MNKINQNHKTNLTKLADYTTIKHHPRVKYKLSNNDYLKMGVSLFIPVWSGYTK